MPSILHLLSRQAGPDGAPMPPMPLSDNRQGDILAASIVGAALAVLTTVGRLAARQRTKANIQADDWLIIGGTVLAFGVVASTLVMVHFGLGRHSNLVTNMEGLVQSVVASQILYSLSVIPIKLSILALYLRLFPSPKLKLAAYSIGTITILYSIAQAVVMGLQVIPLDAMWDMAIQPWVVLDMPPFYICMAVINVFTDMIILTLPMPFIYSLSLQKARKVQVFAVFLTGALVIAFGILRAVHVGTASTEDEPWSDTPAAIYSALEICIGVVSANLPCLRPLFWWLPNKIRGSTSGNTNNSAAKALHGKGAGAPGSSSKRQGKNGANNAYEMARRSRIVGARGTGWESLDDSRALTRASDDVLSEKKVNLAETAVMPSPPSSVSDGSNTKRSSMMPQGGIVVKTTIETSYEPRNGRATA